MKYKIFILLVVLCLVFVGCDSAKDAANVTTNPTTTTPTTQPEAPTEATTEDIMPELTFPEEIQGITLPEYEFTEEDLAGYEVVTVPPATEGEEPETPEETEAPKETEAPIDVPGTLPEHVFDEDD